MIDSNLLPELIIINHSLVLIFKLKKIYQSDWNEKKSKAQKKHKQAYLNNKCAKL